LQEAIVPTDSTRALPDFADPPVNETALSIQFAPLEKFGIPHYGLYWAQIRHEFSRFEIQPPLPSITEQFEDPVRPLNLSIQFISQPDVRTWFIDESGTRLLQIQRDRFVHNWRQRDQKEKYPRYPAVKKTFQVEWSRFCAFLSNEGMGPPQVTQCEVTYVNHIEYNKGWRDYSELPLVISSWSGKTSGQFLPDPEKVNMEAHYLLPKGLGRLHIAVVPILRARDLKEVLQIAVTARGAPAASSEDAIFEWIDLGREWVVKGFADFTSDSMHKIWGRRS
jgi:uncharacterized protein (TIGR04255 family)